MIVQRSSPLKEKGITLLEILAVLVIIALVFIALSRNFGFGADKAKLTDVQQAFKPYQIGFEGALNEYSGLPSANGVNIDYTTMNRYLGKDYQIASPTNGTGSTHPTANPIQTTTFLDPWNKPYQVQSKYVSPKESLLIVRSSGKDKANTVTNDLFYNTQATTDSDDILFVTHYQSGKIKSCSKGLGKDVGVTYITGAGVSLPPVDVDVPLITRQSFRDTYAYEYAVDANIKGLGGIYPSGTVRTYLYSNTPLSLQIRTIGSTLQSREDTIYEESNKTYAGFQMWDNDYDYDIDSYYNWVGSPSSFINNKLGNVRHADYSSIISITDISGLDISSSPNTVMGCK